MQGCKVGMRAVGAVLLAACLCLFAGMAWPVQAHAGTTYTEGALYYTVDDHSITITGYFGRDAEVTVPAMIAGDPVNTIAAGAFDGTAATQVNLPDTIMEIQEGAIGSDVSVSYASGTISPVQSSESAGGASGASSADLESAVPDDATDVQESTLADGRTQVQYIDSSGRTVRLIYNADGTISRLDTAEDGASLEEVEIDLDETAAAASAKTSASGTDAGSGSSVEANTASATEYGVSAANYLIPLLLVLALAGVGAGIAFAVTKLKRGKSAGTE